MGSKLVIKNYKIFIRLIMIFLFIFNFLSIFLYERKISKYFSFIDDGNNKYYNYIKILESDLCNKYQNELEQYLIINCDNIRFYVKNFKNNSILNNKSTDFIYNNIFIKIFNYELTIFIIVILIINEFFHERVKKFILSKFINKN